MMHSVPISMYDAAMNLVDASISRVVVMDQELPQALPGQRVEDRRITVSRNPRRGAPRRIPVRPNTAVGAHVHNGPVFGSIESGSAIYQQAVDAEEVLLGPGDVFYEPAAERISRFDAQDEGVPFLAYFPLTAGQDATLDPVQD